VKTKELLNGINLINAGILGLTFVITQIYVYRQTLDFHSGFFWAFSGTIFAILGGALIWGFMQFRAREVSFKRDDKTKIYISLAFLLNILGLTLTAIGEFLVFSFKNPSLAFQGIAIMLVGGIILASTFYLYNRFIPQQVITVPEMGNTQTVSLH
jgi:fatty acid desaturase